MGSRVLAASARPALVPMDRPSEIPLSFAQRRLWFLDRLEGAGSTYVIPLAVRLTGALDVGALEGALNDVVGRHESLRTVFAETLGVARQVIVDADETRLRLDVTPLSEGELAGGLAQAAGRGFDLAHEIPVRAHLFALSAESHVLLIVLHHIAGDGWSTAPLLRDLASAYGARLRGDAPALALVLVDDVAQRLDQLGLHAGLLPHLARGGLLGGLFAVGMALGQPEHALALL